MKLCISIIALLGVAGTALGGRPPEHSRTEWVIPQTTHAIVGQLLTSKQSRDKKDHILDVTIKPAQNLWGDAGTAVIKTSYKEYIPVVVGNLIPCFIDYTGSGIEFDAKTKTGQDYIFFLEKEQEGFSLLRMEPVANEKNILEVRKKLKDSLHAADNSSQPNQSDEPAATPALPKQSPARKKLYNITEQEAYSIAYKKIAEKMGKQPPSRPEWKYWVSRLSYGYSGGNEMHLIWEIGADFAPAGGGNHASVRIDAVTGEVLQVYVGKHLR